MGDLIRKEEVINIIHNKIQRTSDFLQHDVLIDVEFEVDELPTVEAKEVVHAKWIDGCCSNCGAYIPTDSRIDFIDEEDCKFCYECGCDMRGENDVE